VKTTPGELKADSEHLQLKRLIVPIVAVTNALDVFELIGTAFIIYGVGKQAIALTAAHNVQAIERIERPYDRCHPTTPPMFRFQESRIAFKDTQMRIAYPDLDGNIHLPRVNNAYFLPHHDIAICTIFIGNDEPKDLVFDQRFEVDSSPPLKGTAITAIGYKELSVASHRIVGRRALVHYTEMLVRRPGTVIEVYPDRGPRNQPGPCFQCSTPFDSGMSGGPILELTDEKTVAIGVISSDFSFEYPHRGSGESALASILKPVMNVHLIEETLHQVGGPTLWDFQRKGLIRDRGNSIAPS
jgi:hypothetical protein